MSKTYFIEANIRGEDGYCHGYSLSTGRIALVKCGSKSRHFPWKTFSRKRRTQTCLPAGRFLWWL